MGKQRLGIATETAEAQAPGNLSAFSARILEDYLTELQAIHGMGGGVAETSYYPALSNLFNAVGKTLKPKVRCVMNLRNLGAGMPDGGLFTPDQFQRQADGAPKAGQLPARGAIEAKGTKPDVETIAASQQVKEYLQDLRHRHRDEPPRISDCRARCRLAARPPRSIRYRRR